MTSRSSTERLGDFSSESVVSHPVSWVSSWVVLVWFWLGFGFWLCLFVLSWKTPDFLLSPILQHVGIVNQRQCVLMTVRASSAHGMSSKNLEFWHVPLNHAVTRFLTSHSSDTLLGNQLCHRNTSTDETCMKVISLLVVFLPPARAHTYSPNTRPRCSPL